MTCQENGLKEEFLKYLDWLFISFDVEIENDV